MDDIDRWRERSGRSVMAARHDDEDEYHHVKRHGTVQYTLVYFAIQACICWNMFCVIYIYIDRERERERNKKTK